MLFRSAEAEATEKEETDESVEQQIAETEDQSDGEYEKQESDDSEEKTTVEADRQESSDPEEQIAEAEDQIPVAEDKKNAVDATSGTCGSNVNWRILGSDLYIYGKGSMYDYDEYLPGNTDGKKLTPWIDHNGVIETVYIYILI